MKQFKITYPNKTSQETYVRESSCRALVKYRLKLRILDIVFINLNVFLCINGGCNYICLKFPLDEQMKSLAFRSRSNKSNNQLSTTRQRADCGLTDRDEIEDCSSVQRLRVVCYRIHRVQVAKKQSSA